MDKAYVPIPNWNQAGAIDVKLGPDLGVSGNSAHEVMTVIVSMMFGRFMDLMQFAATPGVRPEQWQESWNDLKNEYTEIFMGVPLQPDYEAETKKQTKRK